MVHKFEKLVYCAQGLTCHCRAILQGYKVGVVKVILYFVLASWNINTL